MKTVLVTGGTGFIGSHVSVDDGLKRFVEGYRANHWVSSEETE